MPPECQFEMTPKPKLNKKGQEQAFAMDPENFGTCSVSAVAEGDLEVINVRGDGTVTVRATADNPVGTVHVTKHCAVSVDPEMPAACGPTTLDIDVGKSSNGKITWRGWILVLLAGGIGFGIGFGLTGNPLAAALFGLGCAGGVLTLVLTSK